MTDTYMIDEFDPEEDGLISDPQHPEEDPEMEL
jgi:hypothetical protein